MVEKKKGVKENNIFSFLLMLIIGIFIVFFIQFISSAFVITTPVGGTTGSNYTGDISLYVTYVNSTDILNPLPGNTTIYWNISGVTTSMGWTLINNNTGWIWEGRNDTMVNITIPRSSFSASFFNVSINITLGNVTNISATSALLTYLRIDAPPNLTAVNGEATIGSNYSSASTGNLMINVTLADNLTSISDVFFNVTNSSGTQNGTYIATDDGGNWYNNSLIVGNYPDGIYNITVYANDTLNNINNTIIINRITIDNTAPSTPVITSSSTTTNSLTLTITVSDALSGINSACSVDRSVTITGTGDTQTITETGLSCGSTYTYTATCSDRAGNSVNSAATSFTTTSCGGGVTSGGGGSSWTGTTYVVTGEQFEEGYTKQIAAKSRMKVKIENNYHYVGVKELTETSATIEITSDPVDVKLDVGEDAKIDVTGDGFYDIYVILNSITNNKADITIKQIYEEIPEGEGPLTTTGEEITGEEPTGEAEKTNLTWLWIILGVLVLAAIIGGGVAAKKRK